MDDRKKLALLDLLKEFAEETDVQCIYSVIHAELPVDTEGHRLELPAHQIIRELSDEGDDGRLFRMPAF